MRGATFAAVLTLAGCTTAAGPKMAWYRVDGRPIPGNAALTRQAQVDATICNGRTQGVAATAAPVTSGGLMGLAETLGQNRQIDDVYRGCMAERGYLLEPVKPGRALQKL